MTLVTGAIRLIRAAKKTYARKWTFLAAFIVVFFASLIVLGKLDLLPDASKAGATVADAPTVTVSASPLVAAAGAALPAAGELPTKIEIPSIKLSANIANPETTDLEVLDNDLLKGAVRYPTSAKLGEQGNVIIFGHSSYLPIVNNQAYKTFDGIQKLHQGDTITVYSSGTAYDYAVDTVTKEDANSAAIPLAVSGQELTLSTCDSFDTKSDRFVVTAHLVGSHLLAS